MIKNCRALKVFLDQVIQDGHLKYVDQEKTRAKEAEVKPRTRFDRGNEETDNVLEEDLPLRTIHMMRGLNHLDLANKIRGQNCFVHQMNEVPRSSHRQRAKTRINRAE